MKNNFRQMLHLEPKKGWLNDPNGLSFFGGEYQVYFQYSPDSAYGSGDKCWGHWSGKDLLNWRFTGAVLRPDTPDDRSGVYSGCGFVKDGLLHLYYTGNVKEDGDHDYVTSGRGANVILVTTEDGVTMSEKRTLLKNADYPEYCSCHVRDPKVWEENGRYRMVLGARTLENKGCVLYYLSEDGVEWSFDEVFGIDGMGYMWECPDVILLDGERFLSISPQGLEHESCRNQNVYSSGYLPEGGGSGDFTEWDYGFDFYAPQTFIAPDGRTLLIGWMGIGDIPYTNPTAELGWQHCLTLFRELCVSGGEILQLPAREYKELRESETHFENGDKINTALPVEIVGRTEESFGIRFGEYLEMTYVGGEFCMSFKDDKAGCGRTERRVRIDAVGEIRIFADTSSIEIYLGGGRRVMSTRFYPDDTDVTLEFTGVSGSIYRLKGIEVSEDV